MFKTDVLIVGAGLTGLSCALSLKKNRTPYILIEKNPWPGGLAASFEKDGFTFDYSGHLLHLRWKKTSKIVKKILDGNITNINRNSKIYFKKLFIDYPFQVNLSNLPEEIRNSCVRDFLIAHGKSLKNNDNFEKWCINTFGKSISKYFMLPYNQKLFKYPLNAIAPDWFINFIPVPKIEEIIKGAYVKSIKNMGYNSDFYYPQKNGIGILPESMAKKIQNINYNSELLSINLRTKTANVKDLGIIKYKKIVNTAPLKFLCQKIEGRPQQLIENSNKLKYNQVYVLNLGIKKVNFKEHWIYFPENEFIFYRIGFYNNFSLYNCPEGASSLYIEISTKADEFIDLSKAYIKVIKSLKKLKIIENELDIITSMWLKIPCAYVIYDHNRAKAIEYINGFLNENKIFSIGRYGSWKYSFMEENIKDGLEMAEKLSFY